MELQYYLYQMMIDKKFVLSEFFMFWTLIFNLYRTLEARGLGGDGNHALIKALENLAGYEVGGDA